MIVTDLKVNVFVLSSGSTWSVYTYQDATVSALAPRTQAVEGKGCQWSTGHLA